VPKGKPRVSPSDSSASETDAKLKLIGFSYAEVLDATKHQDDKIGRLLTSVAFLTAAVLALAGLATAKFLTHTFEVSPFVLPVGLIALAVFLIGIVFTVMLLLASMATPLRLPGLAERKERPSIKWVRNVRASQIYFNEISRIDRDQWDDKWEAPVEDLKEERLASLIGETHNLAVRTNAKHDRTTEAVAVLSLSLLAFALAIIFTVIAAGAGPSSGPVHLKAIDRILIGAVIGSYCGLQLLARIRDARQAVDETLPPEGNHSWVRVRVWGERLYAIFLPILIIDVAAYGRPSGFLEVWIPLTIALAVMSLLSYRMATTPDDASGDPKPTRLTARVGYVLMHRRKRGRLTSAIVAITTIALTTLGLVCGINGWYAGQLGVACLSALGLMVPWVLGPTLRMHDLRKKFKKLRDQPTTAQESA